MQLKIKRSQRDGGIISKTAIFIIDARVVFTPEEQRHVDRYRLWNEHIYSSESAKKSWMNAELSKDGTTSGGLKTLTHSLLASFKLNVTVRSIYSGQHIECKNLEELIYAEECIKTACVHLREYLDIASTFNGSEILIDYSTNEPEIIARSIPTAPEPALIAPPSGADFENDFQEPSLTVHPMAAKYADKQDQPAKSHEIVEEAQFEDIPDAAAPNTAKDEGAGYQSDSDFSQYITQKNVLIVIFVLIFIAMVTKCH